jgi:(2Fe-2S) ferredoxin
VRDGCAARSKACGEALHGTASRARRWVLFEHPGAWGADVLADGTLPPRIAAHLSALATGTPARVLLLRRAPGVPRLVPHHTLFAGVTTPTGGWFERFDLNGPDELFDLDLGPLGLERPSGGEPVTEPFYLVCTNGKHDACCAELGRPVVDVLAPQLGDRLWECSHVGGDRFAGNLVCLPAGVFYGHLDPDVAAEVIRTHEDGGVDLARWRGRSSLPFPVQSAEAFVRAELDLTREDDLRFVGARRDADRTAATFERRTGERVTATVRRRQADVARNLTCKGAPVLAPEHELVSLGPA